MNQRLKEKAEALKPVLYREEIVAGGGPRILTEGESAVFDFGNHYVGYIAIELASTGSPQDAPAFLKLKFCEAAEEIDEDTSGYRGWISRSWLQEEYVHIDVLPHMLRLKRRYAFRFVKVEALGLSQKYKLIVKGVRAVAVTSACGSVPPAGSTDRERRIDAVALRTLRECMQYEFEDGPKRDRRLWLGDLRLQALTNYRTYGRNDLVRRCLYLFAATADREGKISACVFTKPRLRADDTFMFDYSLLFVAVLRDYLDATDDVETARELLPLAIRQFEIAERSFDGDIVRDSDRLGWCFLDWDLTLNKQGGAQAVYLYALNAAIELCDRLGKDAAAMEKRREERTRAAVSKFFDRQAGLFVSGEDRQVSYACNVWFCLASVFDRETNAAVLDRLARCGSAVKPVTPYMMHHYVQALFDCGRGEKAMSTIMEYWGAMADRGADTFYEMFDPNDPDASPYGSKAVNSYCHAWSCTPSYFFRRYGTRSK